MTKLLKLFKKKHTLEERICLIHEGDVEEKNKLIEEYIPFIKKVISDYTGTYVDSFDNDNFSIGLIAFNEAIEKYDGKKGNFLTFAAMVIKSRLIDQFRKQSKWGKEVYISQLQKEEENDSYQDNIFAVEGFEGALDTKLEIKALIDRMKAFDVTMEELVEDGPKHQDTKKMAIKIARHVYENPSLREKFFKSGNLPTGDLMKALNVSKKVVQRSRKFIIAVILILDSDSDTLKQYIPMEEGREVDAVQGHYCRGQKE